jgi:hypothetical protein
VKPNIARVRERMADSGRDRNREIASVSNPATARLRAALAMLAALLAWGRAGREARAGGEHTPIRIDIETCPSQWDPEIRLALAVEFDDQRLAAAPTAEPAAVPGSPREEALGHRVSIRCAEHRVWVVVHDAKTAATLERTLTGDLPEATAPRTIALVAVELLTTFDPALRRRPEPPARPSLPPPAPASMSAPAAPQPPPEPPRLFLTAGGVYRTFLANGGVDAWGGVLDARRASRDGRWSVGLGVELAGGERSTAIGETSALLASARASAGARVGLARERLTLFIDLGARAGAARMSGHANDPNVIASSVVHPWAGPVAALRAELGLSWFCAEIAAEGGWAAVSASGLVSQGTTLAVSGPWLAISLGVGTRR